MRGIRSRRDITSSSTQSTSLITPRMENLTIGPVPSDATNIVISNSNDLGITDKLNALIDQYQPEMVRLASTGACASSITAKVPREFIQSLYDTLNVNDNGCLQETQTFLQMLISYLQSTNDGFINIPRNFWRQIGRVFNELNVNESKINMYAAAMRSMSMAISTDAQSLPSNNLLATTLNSVSLLTNAAEQPIDEDFIAEYPEMILPQPEPTELMSEVISQIPTTIGESSSSPPTNLIDITASDASDNIQVHDLDDPENIEAQAYAGMKELFSVKTLCVPISSLKIVNNGKVKITTYEPVEYVTGVTLTEGELDVTKKTIIVPQEQEIDVSMLDLSKSLLQQDWVVGTRASTRMAEAATWISTIELSKSPQLYSLDETQYRGAITRRMYTAYEVRSIGSALSGLWSKVTSMKLPSPQHIETGMSVLAAGLGAAGTIFGSSGLVKASKVVSTVHEGLGSLIATLSPSNGIVPKPNASISKNALNVIPSALDAGKGIFESLSVNAQQQRIQLNGIKKEVETDYIMPTLELNQFGGYKRINNVFY